MDRIYEGTIKLYSHRNMITGNELVDKEYVPQPKDIAKLGLFDSSSPNYVTFTPGVTAESFTPKEEDFINPTYRLLSKSVLPRGGNPIDFTYGDVLKESMHLLVGQTIYPDHEGFVGNGLGVISAVEWQESYTFNGKKIPAGINGTLKIDAVANPRIARQILMRPPAIHSSSVTVNFGWKKSHSLSDEEFNNRLGTIAEDGKLVSKVVTNIRNYYENSLVPHGADVFAKQLDENGKPIAHNLLPETVKNSGVLNYSSLTESGFSETESFTSNNKQNMQKLTTAELKKGFLALAKLVNVDLTNFNFEEATPESFLESVVTPLTEGFTTNVVPENLVTLMENRPDITLESVIALEENQQNPEQTEELTKYRELGTPEVLVALIASEQAQLESLRNTTTTNYRLSQDPGTADKTIEAVLSRASREELEAFNKSYQVTLEARFPLECQKCNSTDIARRSSASNSTEPKIDIQESIRKAKASKASDIHR